MVYISGGNELLDPYEILKKLGVETGSKIADLGCGGAGHFIIPAANIVGKDTVVYAVDILKTVLRSVISKARIEGVYNIKSIWSNLEIIGATNIKTGSLDFALLINTLFQTQKHEAVMAEAVRLIKPDGKLLIIDWGQALTPFGPPPSHRVKADEVKKAAARLKLTLDEEFKAGAYHYGLIYSK